LEEEKKGSRALLYKKTDPRFAVDGFWRHDPELPAIKNELGHFNNQVSIP
jgi:hypothetical protein